MTPALIAIGGLSGTGKSTLAHALAARIGAVVLRSDVVRKRLAGLAPTVPLPPSAYTSDARAAAYCALRHDIRSALGAGTAVIADAVWATPEDRAALEALAAEMAVGFCGLWLVAPLEAALRRVAARVGDASDATEQTVRAQAAVAPPPPAGWRVIAADAGPAAVLDAALAALDQTVR